jgi:hypothetical protein
LVWAAVMAWRFPFCYRLRSPLSGLPVINDGDTLTQWQERTKK